MVDYPKHECAIGCTCHACYDDLPETVRHPCAFPGCVWRGAYDDPLGGWWCGRHILCCQVLNAAALAFWQPATVGTVRIGVGVAAWCRVVELPALLLSRFLVVLWELPGPQGATAPTPVPPASSSLGLKLSHDARLSALAPRGAR